MTDTTRPVGEDDIEAYIDGRLSPDRVAMVEAMIANDRRLSERVLADMALKLDLRERLGHVVQQPIPARLRIGTIQARRRASLQHWARNIAAGVALVALGGGAGWQAHLLYAPGAAPIAASSASLEAADAISAHRVFVVETAHPVEVGVSQQAHLVQWLSRRVGHPLRAPDLSAEGYQLMGGRLLPAEGDAAAQFMYEDRAGGRLTLYVRATSVKFTGFQFAQDRGVSAFSWFDDGLGFAMVANVDRTRLAAIADVTYRQLESQTGSTVSH
jgi:anti-sigma factor RsiW